jgi:hypothetical protein
MGYVALAISLLQTVLASANANGEAQSVVATIQAAIAKLLETEGSDVSYQQLEGLRSKTTW